MLLERPRLTSPEVGSISASSASTRLTRSAKHERDRVRQELLDYCQRDTWAMVRLVECLRELARVG